VPRHRLGNDPEATAGGGTVARQRRYCSDSNRSPGPPGPTGARTARAAGGKRRRPGPRGSRPCTRRRTRGRPWPAADARGGGEGGIMMGWMSGTGDFLLGPDCTPNAESLPFAYACMALKLAVCVCRMGGGTSIPFGLGGAARLWDGVNQSDLSPLGALERTAMACRGHHDGGRARGGHGSSFSFSYLEHKDGRESGGTPGDRRAKERPVWATLPYRGGQQSVE
jgi:hypothetical protein